MEFKKEALTTRAMVEKLMSRGMNVKDLSAAEHILNHINYYRLSPYWRIFEVDRPNGDHSFQEGTNFNQVMRHYEFDKSLRMLLMAEIDRIEISLRRGWASHLATHYGPFANQTASLFKDRSQWRASLSTLMREYDKSPEIFAKHYLEKYGELSLPPIWICVELMTFGNLSKMISNLDNPKDRQEIAQYYALDEVVLVSVLHHLVNVRNFVAHHSRIWNRKFVFKFKVPQNKSVGLKDFFVYDEGESKKIYNTLVMLIYLTNLIDHRSSFKKDLLALLGIYPEIDPAAMGFPTNWMAMDFWT